MVFPKFNSYSKILYIEVIYVVFPLYGVGIAFCNTSLKNNQPLFQAPSCHLRKVAVKKGDESTGVKGEGRKVRLPGSKII